MAKSDQTYPQNALRPRARLLRTLGEELISNEVVAVIELVKNAYDADATRVLIRFVGPLEPNNGCIEVIDNGHGMELGVVKSVWMEPATPSKRDKPRSEKFKRRHLGAKGIGRFASSRLAHELEVISKRENQEKEVYAIFDWRQFEDDNRYLDEIEILWEERSTADIKPGGLIQHLWKSERTQPSNAELDHGTILRMSGLKQEWTAKQFEDLRRGLARLVSPRTSKEEDFEIELELPATFSEYSSKVGAPEILRHPHYVISGTVDSVGKYYLQCEIRAEGIEREFHGQFLKIENPQGRLEVRGIDEGERLPKEIKQISCGPLEIELRVWDRDDLGNVIQSTRSTIQDVRRDLDAVSGINIYRDGFRVLPYGEPLDDSFRLDRRRVQNPTLRLSNNQIYGTVVITADGNPDLVDQSNRQGMQENQAFNDFSGVMLAVLSKLEEMRHAVKRPKKEDGAGKAVGGLFSGFDMQPLSDYIAAQFPKDEAAKALLKTTEKAFSTHLKEIQTVLARYQRLATLGQLIDHVLHEGRQPIASINNEAYLGLSDIVRAKDEMVNMKQRLSDRFSLIRKQGDILAIAFKRMEPFGGRRRGRPSQLYLENIVRDAFAVFEDDLRRLKVNVVLPESETLVRVDPAEMQEIIINLLQNSLYWLEQVDEPSREILVDIERKGSDHLDLLFADSGPGVPKENRDLIFDPYFSTKVDGVGLGLSIVGEIITDYYGGAFVLLEHGPLPGANFLVTLRKRV